MKYLEWQQFHGHIQMGLLSGQSLLPLSLISATLASSWPAIVCFLRLLPVRSEQAAILVMQLK